MARTGTRRLFNRFRRIMSLNRYSPAFPLRPGVDFVVESSDGTLFAVRALHLRSVSSVSDDILSLPTNEDQDKKDGHPVLKLEENAPELEAFLRYAHRNQPVSSDRSSFVLPKLEWSTILLLSKMFDKYHTPLLASLVFSDQLRSFLPRPDSDPIRLWNGRIAPAEVFAVAVIHRLEVVAREALRVHHLVLVSGWYIEPPVKQRDYSTGLDEGWRPSGLGELPAGLLARMSGQHIQRYSAIRDRVLLVPSYTWEKAAKDFDI